MSRLHILFTVLFACQPFQLRAQAPRVQVVQQPVVRQFGIGSSVSVPDGGRAHLGGVSRAASGRNSYGPIRSGTNSGFEMSNASQSVSVSIIDLDTMDQELLESASRNAAARADKRKIPPRAELAWQSLQARQRKQR
jgi:hypothetical protein